MTEDLHHYKVILFFRKLRATGNFSIETSFKRMQESFPADSEFRLTPFTLSHYSNGALPRLRGVFEARQHRSDVNHVTGDVHYLVLGLPPERTILTIHDCGFLNHPNAVARRILKWLWLDWPVRHCRYVTAVSEATKRQIVQQTRCPEEKVLVVPTVISDDFRPADKAFDRRCPKILHIGLAPNKNFERHVQALEHLECRLHIVGKLEMAHVRVLETHKIQYTNEYNISDSAMQRAYEECDILLFASTLEGFGMPILEAQTVGRVVVTSRISSMPEVAGEGACLVDPWDVKSIRTGLRRVIEDTQYREDLIEAGFRNVERFSASNVARQYEVIYRKVVTSL